MNTKLFISHIIITLISIAIFSIILVNIENDTYEIIFRIVFLILILSLYILSGYLSTNTYSKVNISEYSIIAVIGIIIWVFCFWTSPTDLNWKKGDGGVWLFYMIYVSSLLESTDWIFQIFKTTKLNIKVSIFLLLSLSIIPSFMQYLGGLKKRNELQVND